MHILCPHEVEHNASPIGVAAQNDFLPRSAVQKAEEEQLPTRETLKHYFSQAIKISIDW